MKRMLAKALVFLLAGAAMTAAVAWTLLLSGVTSHNLRLERIDSWPAWVPKDWSDDVAAVGYSRRGVRLILLGSLPASFLGELKHTQSALDELIQRAMAEEAFQRKRVAARKASSLTCGWPWPALRSRQWSWNEDSTGKEIARGDTLWQAGSCPCCGYELTGNTTGTCPECGMAAVP